LRSVGAADFIVETTYDAKAATPVSTKVAIRTSRICKGRTKEAVGAIIEGENKRAQDYAWQRGTTAMSAPSILLTLIRWSAWKRALCELHLDYLSVSGV
jgi:hypothetical protein